MTRLIVPACIGCGAMGRPAGCANGCREQRLDLVPAAPGDRAEAIIAAGPDRLRALRAALRELVARTSGSSRVDCFLEAQQAACATLAVLGPAPTLPELEAPTTTWWCPDCGGLEAPQPCLGVCIWRPAQWMPAEELTRARERASAVLAREHVLRGPLARLACITPRPGFWDRRLVAVQAAARVALAVDAGAVQSSPAGGSLASGRRARTSVPRPVEVSSIRPPAR